jgi:hypothetical protein
MTVPGAVDGAGAAVAETAVGRLVTDELESGSSLSQATNANTTRDARANKPALITVLS